MCCSNQRDQNELKFRKPERNILLNRRGSDYKYGITPGINYEIDRISENKDELEIIEHAKSNNKIITNDEFVYGRIDTMKNPKEIKLKNSYKNNYLYESEKLRNEIIEDEDGPKDGVKKKSLKTNYKTNFDNKNITTNSEVKSIEINTNNFLDNFNISNNNNINDSMTQIKLVHPPDNFNDFNSNDNNNLKIKSETNLDYIKSNNNIDNFPKYTFPEPKTEKNKENFISNNYNSNTSIERINNIDFTNINKDVNINNKENINNNSINNNNINNNINNNSINNNISNYNLSNEEEVKKNTTIDINNINSYIIDNNNILKNHSNNINDNNDFIEDKNNNLNNSIKPKVFVKPIVAQSNNNNNTFYLKKKVEKEINKYTNNNIISNSIKTNIITSKIKEYENEKNNNNKNEDIIRDNSTILSKDNKIQTNATVKKLGPIQYLNNNSIIRTKPLPIIENNDDKYNNNNISIKNDIIYNSNISPDNDIIQNNLYINNTNDNIKEDINDRKNKNNNVLRKDIYKNSVTTKISTLDNNNNINKIQQNENKNILPAMSLSPKEIDDIFVEGERKYNIMNINQNIVENNNQNQKNIVKKVIPDSNINENYTYNYNNNKVKTPNYKNQSNVFTKSESQYNQSNIPEQKIVNEVKNDYSRITKIEKIIPRQITKIEKSIAKDPLITSDVNFNKRIQAFTPEKKIKAQSTPYIYPLTPDQTKITHSKPDINLAQINHSKSLINYNIYDEIDRNINYNINETINNNTNNQYVQAIPNNNKINKNISKIETTQYDQNQIYTYNPVIEKQNVKYKNPSKNLNVNAPSENYNSPLKNVKTYVEYNSPSKTRNDPGFDYNSLTHQTRHVIINSPVKINKPIYQYKKSEETAPITYSPTKVLPPIITYTNSETYSKLQYYPNSKNNQANQINNLNTYTNIPNVNSPKKTNTYEINQALTMNYPQKNYKVDNKIVSTYYTTDNINNFPIVQKDPNEAILNQNYLNNIKNYNLNSRTNYQISSLRSNSSGSSDNSNLSSKKRKFDSKGNPIYQVSLNQDEGNKHRKNRFSKDLRSSLSSNSNNNYSPIYYSRSLSQEDFNGPILKPQKNNQFSDYDSRGSSPNSVISDNQKSIDKNIYNNINNLPIYQQVQSPANISLIRPTTETIDDYKRVIDYYSKLDCTKFVTFSPESYQLFYPKNEPYFIIPKNEIYSEQDITRPINNNPNLTETYIGSINKLGYRHGFGKLITPYSKKIGTWRNGKFTGWGREIGKNGQVFEGKFSDGKLNGKGIYKNGDKVLYVGDFQNHLRQGKGEKITKNYHYKGHFNNDKIDGYGKIQFFNSKEGISEYQGYFKDNNIEGKGIIKWNNGNMYEGDVKEGKMNGNGKFFPKNGVPIEGYFINGIKVNNTNINRRNIF